MNLFRLATGQCRISSAGCALIGAALLSAALMDGGTLYSQQQLPTVEERNARSRRISREAEAKGLAEAFKGVTTNGSVVSGLFHIESTGVSTAPVRQAAAKATAPSTM